MIVAEIAQAHDGSLGAAHSYIDAVARTGVDAIKFQTHIASAESTPKEPFRVRFSSQDASRYEYWKRMEFKEDEWRGLSAHAHERGLLFLSSPFSFQAVDLLERLGMPAWKIGSGEANNLPMLERLARTRQPILLSTGLASFQELDASVACVREHKAPLALLQCTTAYPCPPEKLGLNVLSELRARYSCPVGLSDHSATIYAGLGARMLGANLLEVHAVFSRECFGPDSSSSLTTTELSELVRGVRFLERALVSPIDKNAMAQELVDLKRTFGKSVVAARDLETGIRLSEQDLALKKPGTGIPAAELSRLIGRTLKRPLALDTLLGEDDLA